MTAGRCTPTTARCSANKSGATRLGFAVLLKLFQAEGCFPRRPEDVPVAAVEAIAVQVGVPAAAWRCYDWHGRAIRYHRAQIRAALNFREATDEDAAAPARWLEGRVLGLERRHDRLLAEVREHCRALKLEPPSPERLERVARSALHRQEEAFCAALIARLPPAVSAGLDALLRVPDLGDTAREDAEGAPLLALRAGAGPARLQSVDEEADKLRRIRALDLPADLFDGVPARVLLVYRRRVGAEELHELRRHPTALRLPCSLPGPGHSVNTRSRRQFCPAALACSWRSRLPTLPEAHLSVRSAPVACGDRGSTAQRHLSPQRHMAARTRERPQPFGPTQRWGMSLKGEGGHAAVLRAGTRCWPLPSRSSPPCGQQGVCNSACGGPVMVFGMATVNLSLCFCRTTIVLACSPLDTVFAVASGCAARAWGGGRAASSHAGDGASTGRDQDRRTAPQRRVGSISYAAQLRRAAPVVRLFAAAPPGGEREAAYHALIRLTAAADVALGALASRRTPLTTGALYRALTQARPARALTPDPGRLDFDARLCAELDRRDAARTTSEHSACAA